MGNVWGGQLVHTSAYSDSVIPQAGGEAYLYFFGNVENTPSRTVYNHNGVDVGNYFGARLINHKNVK